ncbi:MAG: hypothetical protein OIF57_15525 [Marinobacterium sp.]|nr:hypothetical protein [Marinobacterium sp.]
MFHITNGDNASQWLAQCGITGDFLGWDDVLHEGPVPGGLTLHELSLIRARFISFCGWATEFEAQTHFQTRDARFLDAARHHDVVIWNSHELFDQLHMLQVLSWYYREGQGLKPPRLVFVDALLGDGSLQPPQLKAALMQALPATAAQLEKADELWQLFTAANPRGLACAAAQAITPFPFMQLALQRLLQEYPDAQGLSRTQRAALDAVKAGADNPVALFQVVRQQEDIPFMGDASFWQIVADLCAEPYPLVCRQDNLPFQLPDIFAPSEAFRNQPLQLTALGYELLAGQQDWLSQPVDRWLGGVHLNPENCWCWVDGSFQRR